MPDRKKKQSLLKTLFLEQKLCYLLIFAIAALFCGITLCNESDGLPKRKVGSPAWLPSFDFSQVIHSDIEDILRGRVSPPSDFYELEHWRCIAQKRREWERREEVRLLAPDLYAEVERLLSGPVRLKKLRRGAGGAYFLKASKHLQFIIKPDDEDIGMIHNPQYYRQCGFQSLRSSHGWLKGIPCYTGSQRSMAASEIAKAMQMSITPEVIIHVVRSSDFYPQDEDYIQTKLCSVQRFVKRATPLYDWYLKQRAEGKPGEAIFADIEERDFELAMIFVWITADLDAHLHNFIVYPQNGKMRLAKIDNNGALPNLSAPKVRNDLIYTPKAKQRLSSEARQFIQEIDEEECRAIVEIFGLGSSAENGVVDRILKMKKLACEDLSFKQMHEALFDSR